MSKSVNFAVIGDCHYSEKGIIQRVIALAQREKFVR
jgi:hypothetical protein